MKVLWFLARRFPGTLAIAVLAGVLSGATSGALLAVVHAALAGGGVSRGFLVACFVGLCVLNPTARVGAEYLLLGMGQGMVREMRLQLTRSILSTPLARLEELGSHRLLATLVDDVNALANAMAQLPILSVTAAIVAGCFVYLAWLSWTLFGMLIAVTALGIVTYQIPLLAGERRFTLARAEQDQLFDHFRALTGGIQELKLHRRRAAAFVDRVRERCRSLYRLNLSSLTIFSVSNNWGHLLFFVVLGVLIFAVPGWFAVDTADLTGYALTLLYLMSPLEGFLGSIPIFSRAGVALAKVESLGLALNEADRVGAGPKPIPEADWRRLELDGVRYVYEREDSRHDFVVGPLELAFQPGELVFLVGGNGSGKTTFAKLLVGLYLPTSGSVRLDGRAVTDAERDDYRQLFSMVFATPHVFEHLLGIEYPDADEKSSAYLQALELGEKVRVEDGKLSTTALSQGQRKRLALLTAYLEDRPIYVFDEWAADQDPAFREVFYSRILPELKARGKTLVVISHDDRYYAMADRIVKLELGRIVYDGDFEGFKAVTGSAAPAVAPVPAARRTTAAEPKKTAMERELPAGKDRPRRRRRLWPVTAAALLTVPLLGLGGFVWFRDALTDSLPRLEGQVALAGLEAPVEVERDALGVPTLRGASRRDVAFATGFVHAQDRYFQMDLLRRRSAGELAELFGEDVLQADLAVRRHRFRHRAGELVRHCTADVGELLEAYTLGVNAGLSDLGNAPFEYLVLRATPRPWKAEDTLLVLLAMFVDLQTANGTMEEATSLLADTLPADLVRFLTPAGTEWDAPILGEALPSEPVPGPEVIDLRRAAGQRSRRSAGPPSEVAPVAGSNGFAVSAARSGAGAWLANDLHLSLTVPNVWYRAVFVWPKAAGPDEHRVAGATLPGTPLMVVGSNGKVAWGVTNGVVDTHDYVLLEVDPGDPDVYRTPDGPKEFERHVEIVRLRGGGEHRLEVLETQWGPRVDDDHRERPRALRWTAHEPEAVQLESYRLETAQGVTEALEAARRAGTPAMNFFAVDTGGGIGWTLMGRLPRRRGFSGRRTLSWADGTSSWQGLLPAAEAPSIVDPPSGQIWNANNRMVGGETYQLLGDGGYQIGARARQIRDALTALEHAGPADLLAIQLDDRALFFDRWRELLLELLDGEAVAASTSRGELRNVVSAWDGHASADAAGYRLVRAFRQRVAREVFSALTARCRDLVPEFDYTLHFRQLEGPLWRLVTERPAHLLDPRYGSWREYLLAAADATVDYFGRPLAEQTWGRRNTAAIRHPLSLAIPGLGCWLDMPADPLPGDEYVPRVQAPDYGATLRMVVSPGREGEGFFHMPGGQSGHPFSPHYRDGHGAWARGEPTPFLPGTPVRRLRLVSLEAAAREPRD